MSVQAGFARIAALLADPAREAILVALADGRALPAGELAELAGITPQSASFHLRKLVEGGIISVWVQGRFRYFRLADERVGTALETLVAMAQLDPQRTPTNRRHPAHLVMARCCYNHLAGRLAVAMAQCFQERGYVQMTQDSATLTPSGYRWAEDVGLTTGSKPESFANLRPCLDWTERRFHLAGGFPTAVLRYLLKTNRLRRGAERSLTVTTSGELWFRDLGIEA